MLFPIPFSLWEKPLFSLHSVPLPKPPPPSILSILHIDLLRGDESINLPSRWEYRLLLVPCSPHNTNLAMSPSSSLSSEAGHGPPGGRVYKLGDITPLAGNNACCWFLVHLMSSLYYQLGNITFKFPFFNLPSCSLQAPTLSPVLFFRWELVNPLRFYLYAFFFCPNEPTPSSILSLLMSIF